MLDPRPRNFLAAEGLSEARILETLRTGKPGTAMKRFEGTLSEREMRDVARFVARTFVACGRENTDYHTVENGWPDHAARYAPAFPFVTGEIALDAPEARLSASERRGRALFRGSCISCHDGRLERPAPLGLRLALGTGAQADARPAADPLFSGEAPGAEDGHEGEYGAPTVHDIAPEIPDLTAEERRGEALYTRACAECHAADGSGRNWIGTFLEPSPPDFRALGAEDFDAGAFARATLDAAPGTTMPSFRGVLGEAEAAAIAAYVARAFVSAPSSE